MSYADRSAEVIFSYSAETFYCGFPSRIFDCYLILIKRLIIILKKKLIKVQYEIRKFACTKQLALGCRKLFKGLS